MPQTSAQDRYLAVSGGGFQTHSLSAGWLAGGMDGLLARGKDSDIDQLLGNIKGVASSSGGSWFSAMLAFSPKFRALFESKGARDSYNITGYNGAVKTIFSNLFNADGTPKLSAKLTSYLRTVELALNAAQLLLKPIGVNFNATALISSIRQVALTDIFLSGESGLSWQAFVDKYVLPPLNIQDDLKQLSLASKRSPWANDVDLLFGAALQTSDVVLGKIASTLSNNYPTVSHQAVNIKSPKEQQYTPLSLLSLAPSGPGETPQPSALFPAGLLKSTYRGLSQGRQSKTIQKSIPSQLSNALSLVNAITISSATLAVGAGLGALASVLTKSQLLQNSLNALLKPISYGLRDMATSAGAANGVLGPLTDAQINSKSVDALAQIGALRLADSAFSDNTAVGHLVRHIQDKNGLSKPFSIVLLMNSNEAPDPVTGLQKRVRVGPDAKSLSRFGLPAEVANLFGQSNGDGTLDGDAITLVRFPVVKVPSAHVFDASAWYGRTAPDWSYSKGSISLSYHKVDVTTVNNKNFGVKAGQTGQVHIFSAFNTESQPAPFTRTVLTEYAENYDVYREAIASGGGLPYLQAALGLGPTSS